MGKKHVKIQIGYRTFRLFPQDISKIHRTASKIMPPVPLFN